MKLKLGKFEIESEGDKVEVKVSTVLGSDFQAAKIELDRMDAIKLRNWLNSYINGNDE